MSGKEKRVTLEELKTLNGQKVKFFLEVGCKDDDFQEVYIGTVINVERKTFWVKQTGKQKKIRKRATYINLYGVTVGIQYFDTNEVVGGNNSGKESLLTTRIREYELLPK